VQHRAIGWILVACVWKGARRFGSVLCCGVTAASKGRCELRNQILRSGHPAILGAGIFRDFAEKLIEPLM